MNKRRCGLKAQSLIALLISFCVAVAVFFAVERTTSALLTEYLKSNSYIGKKSHDYMDKFENYVTKYQIAADDSEAINFWRYQNKEVTTIIYINRDGETLYDSLMLTRQYTASDDGELSAIDSNEKVQYVGSEYSDNSWFYKREITFADGVASVSLYGYFDQWIYDVALFSEITLSTGVLCLVFVWLTRKKINYVLQLEEEIKVLETGGLDFPITIKGNDELSSLADSLNQMRIALSENIKTESAAVKSNYDLVVAISHDLRTPLTSLALYLDLIHAGKCKNPADLNAYIEKSRGKVSQIKQMTDQLFERFYLEKDSKRTLEKPEPVKTVFEDGLSNMANYFGENGFSVEPSVVWPEKSASVSADYVNRIFDNISSNVLKYADPNHPVVIDTGAHGGNFRIKISNHIKKLIKKPDSTAVGADNIRFMMDKMNGDCSIKAEKGIYSICLILMHRAN